MKLAKKILCLILAAAVLLSMTACGDGKKAPMGYYVLTEKQEHGKQAPFLLFQEDGTIVCFNGTEILEASWKQGELELAGNSMPCTEEGDILTLEAGDGVLHFEKSEEKAPDPEELAQKLKLRKLAGTYLLSDGSRKSVTEQVPFLLLREDRTAACFDGAELKEGTWEENRLMLSGESPMDWTAEGKNLTLSTGKEELHFQRSEKTPDLTQLRSQLQILREAGYYVLNEKDWTSEIEQIPFLLLQEDGNAAFFDGEFLRKGTWEAGQLSLGRDSPMAYAVKDGNLTLSSADGKLHFLKSGEEAPDPGEVEEALKSPREPGYYEMKEICVDDETVSMEDLGQELYLALYEDGTGAICLVESDYEELLWKDGILTDSDTSMEIADYTMEKGGLRISCEGIELVFVRCSKTPPDRENLKEKGRAPEVGYFVVRQLELGGITLSEEQLKEMYRILPFALFSEDGTAALYDGTELINFEWEDGCLYLPETEEAAISYEIDGDELYLSEEEAEMILERSSRNPPDLDRLAAGGTDFTGEYALYSYNPGDGEHYDAEVTLSLQEDGTGICRCGSEVLDCTWDGNALVMDGDTFSCRLQEDGSLFLEGNGGSLSFRPVSHGAQSADFWNNDWYGWWGLMDCTGDMEDREDSWWDMCGRSSVNADGSGRFILWDEDYNSIKEPVAEMEFQVENSAENFSGTVYSISGRILDQKLGVRDLVCNPDESPYDNMLTFYGKYTTGTGSCSYMIILRPWGISWDDADEFYLPYYYETWYLPKIEAGESMPETMNAK